MQYLFRVCWVLIHCCGYLALIQRVQPSSCHCSRFLAQISGHYLRSINLAQSLCCWSGPRCHVSFEKTVLISWGNIGFVEICIGDLPLNKDIEGWFELRHQENLCGFSQNNIYTYLAGHPYIVTHHSFSFSPSLSAVSTCPAWCWNNGEFVVQKIWRRVVAGTVQVEISQGKRRWVHS